MSRLLVSSCCQYSSDFLRTVEHVLNPDLVLYGFCNKCKQKTKIISIDFEPFETVTKGIRRPKFDLIKKHGFDPIKFLYQFNNL